MRYRYNVIYTVAVPQFRQDGADEGMIGLQGEQVIYRERVTSERTLETLVRKEHPGAVVWRVERAIEA